MYLFSVCRRLWYFSLQYEDIYDECDKLHYINYLEGILLHKFNGNKLK